MIASIVMMATAAVANAPIAPPLGVTIHQTTEESRNDGRRTRRYWITRDLRFAAEPGGFRITIVMTGADSDAETADRLRYRAANVALIGQTIVMHLDPAGGLLSIDDLDALWARWTAGLAAATPPGGNGAAAAMRARLDALPAARRVALFGSIATDLFAAPDEREVAAARPVTLVSPAPFSAQSMTGVSSVTAETGRLHVHIEGSAKLTAPGNVTADVGVVIDRRVDPVSRLIVSATRTEKVVGERLKLRVQHHTALSW